MNQILEGDLNGSGLKIAVIAARFNEVVVDSLLQGAISTLNRLSVKESDIAVIRVPGAFEIPGVAARLVESGRYDAVICLGAVIRGETPHFDMVVSATTNGIAKLAADSRIPVVFGVLTTDTVEQAMNRAGLKAGNKGSDMAMVAVEMSRLYSKIQVKGRK